MLTFNNAIQTFPAVVLAGALGFSKREFFEIDDGDSAAPAVSFAADAAPPARRRVTHRARSGLVLLAALAAALSASRERPSAKSYTLAPGERDRERRCRTARCTSTSRSSTLLGLLLGRLPRDPARQGESISDVSVQENGTQYQAGWLHRPRLHARPPARSASRTSAARIGSSGTTSAVDESKTFEIRYRLSGLAVAYDDVVDVNLDVWGDEWKAGLAQLTATLHAPGPVMRAWGNPVYVRGDVQLAGQRRALRALDVPAHQFVELRALIPRAAFTLDLRHAGRARARASPRSSPAEQADAAASSATTRRSSTRSTTRCATSLYPARARPRPGAARRCSSSTGSSGASARTGYDREYEQEPPTDTAAGARARRSSAQGGEAGSFEFTATLFDLIRRGVYNSKPVTTERSTWAGLHKEQVSDLELSRRRSRRRR